MPRYPQYVLRSEASEFVLAELGLLCSLGKGQYEFVRGVKEEIDALFTYALLRFWESYLLPSSNTLRFDDLVHQYGSPGRVFKNERVRCVADRLERIEDITKGRLIWSNVSISEVTRIQSVQKYCPVRYIGLCLCLKGI